MPQLSIERSIKIHAAPSKVWSSFTEPEYTRHFGGEFVTEWNVGSAFNWKGLDGKLYTRGEIVKIDPGKLLQYNLFRPQDKNSAGSPQIFSVITYELHEEDEYTTLLARENFMSSLTQQEFTLAGAAWFEALARVKVLAENNPLLTFDLVDR